MFTGLVEAIGKVVLIQEGNGGKHITLELDCLCPDTKIGSSICVDGVCLTVEKAENNHIRFFAVPETLRRSTLKFLRTGDPVNLERSLLANSRLEGHFVSGHVDFVGKILQEEHRGNSIERWIHADDKYDSLIAEKGSIAVDGISLTVARKEPGSFSVALIPHTLKVTAAGAKRTGSLVNIETDILAKYTQSFLGKQKKEMTLASLQDMGY